jgi:hypothetical protein
MHWKPDPGGTYFMDSDGSGTLKDTEQYRTLRYRTSHRILKRENANKPN